MYFFQALTNHIYRWHNPNRRRDRLDCPICKKRNLYNLKSHMITHGEREYLNCPDCPKIFARQNTLDYHQRTTHKGLPDPKEVLCYQCGAALRTNSQLNRHLKSHLEYKSYACDQCDKTYKRSDALKTHIRNTHLNIREFVCTDCGLAFFNNRLLTNHKRIHTGEKPFVCEICQQAFTHHAGMFLHKKHQHLLS